MPDDARLHQLLETGRQHHHAGRLPQAEAAYRQVLAQYPNDPDALHQMGLIAQECNKSPIAADLVRRAIAVDPNRAEFHCDLGRILRDQGDFDNAMIAFQTALQLKPDFAEAYNSMGTALKERGRLDEAIAAHRRALELNPQFAEAHNNLGRALHARGDIDDAIDAYRKAIALIPDYPPMHLNLGLALLSRGDFLEGWIEHEWRWRMRELAVLHQHFVQPIWDGSDLNGKRILIHTEGGYGDTIQFARYAKLVAQRGGKVIFGCWAELGRLMSTLDHVEQVVTPGQAMPEFDLHCPLGSVPAVLKTTLATIPAEIPYLRADPALSAQWKSRLSSLGDTLKVGIVWAGRQTPDPGRSVPTGALAPLARVSGVSFVSLQKGATDSATRGEFNPIDWTIELKDFADTAALIDNLDLVISIDTGTAHLAGAMGKPVWMLVKRVPDWRWLMQGSDCPWYPTMKMFRQPTHGDWETPIQQIAKALQEFKAKPS